MGSNQKNEKRADFSGLEREIRKSVKSNRTENDGPNRTAYFLYPSWQSISRSERESNETTSPPSLHPNAGQRKEKTKLLNRVSSTTIVPKLGASTSQAITTGGYSIESLLE